MLHPPNAAYSRRIQEKGSERSEQTNPSAKPSFFSLHQKQAVGQTTNQTFSSYWKVIKLTC